MSDRAIIGIDPGANGGLAYLSDEHLEVFKCPKNAEAMGTLINRCISNSEIGGYTLSAVIEEVWARPMNSVRSSFTFGVNYGKWLGILGHSFIPRIKVIPQTWMSEYQPLPRNYTERKNSLLSIAEELSHDYEIKVTKQTADAILIAFWGMNNHNIKTEEE
jgi:hypothetical protein